MDAFVAIQAVAVEVHEEIGAVAGAGDQDIEHAIQAGKLYVLRDAAPFEARSVGVIEGDQRIPLERDRGQELGGFNTAVAKVFDLDRGLRQRVRANARDRIGQIIALAFGSHDQVGAGDADCTLGDLQHGRHRHG